MTNDTIEKALVLIKKEELNFEKAFNKLLTYLAINLFVDSDIDVEFKATTLSKLDELIDISKLRKSKKEVLLDTYYKYATNTYRKSGDLTDVLKLARMTKHTFPRPVFVDDLDTSQMTSFHKNIMVYTTTNDLIKYRIDIINRELFGIPMFELYIGELTNKELNLDVTSRNWEFANRWVPVNTTHFERAAKVN